MAREGGIERISACKKQYISLSTLALGCLFCLQKVLSSMKRPIGKYTGMLPEVLSCLSCVCVCLCLCMSECMFASLCCVCALRHTPPQPCSLRISLQEWDPTRIRNTFSFLPFKQVADCFNKDVNQLWTKIGLHSTAIYCISQNNLLTCWNKLLNPSTGWFPGLPKLFRLVWYDGFIVFFSNSDPCL